jgi:hypothetical protein
MKVSMGIPAWEGQLLGSEGGEMCLNVKGPLGKRQSVVRKVYLDMIQDKHASGMLLSIGAGSGETS